MEAAGEAPGPVLCAQDLMQLLPAADARCEGLLGSSFGFAEPGDLDAFPSLRQALRGVMGVKHALASSNRSAAVRPRRVRRLPRSPSSPDCRPPRPSSASPPPHPHLPLQPAPPAAVAAAGAGGASPGPRRSGPRVRKRHTRLAARIPLNLRHGPGL